MEHLVSSNLSFPLSFFLYSFISFLHSFSHSFFLSSHLPCIPGLLYFYCIYTIFISHLSRSYLTSLSTSTFTVHISFSPPHTMPCRTIPYYAVLCRTMPYYAVSTVMSSAAPLTILFSLLLSNFRSRKKVSLAYRMRPPV